MLSEPLTKTCQRCGCQRMSLNHHHVIPKSQGGADDPSNIQELCANCHAEVHGGLFGGRIGGAPKTQTPEARAKRNRTMQALNASGVLRPARVAAAIKGVGKRDHEAHADKIKASWTTERRAAQSEYIKAVREEMSWSSRGDGAGIDRWSAVFPACIECNTTSTPHRGMGLCKTCYARAWMQKRNADKPRKEPGHSHYLRGPCQQCGQEHWLHKHHIIPRSQGGSNDPTNLVRLCSNCHEDIHDGPVGANLRRTPEVEAKRAAAVRQKWADPEWKARRLVEMRESLKNVDHKAKGRKTAAAWTPEKRAEHAKRISDIKRAAGVVISAEQRRQISETLKAKYASGEIVPPTLGKKFSDETRAKQSAAKQGDRHPNWAKHLSAETRARITAANRGQKRGPMSEEQKLKISASLRMRQA
jgi:5-methylcytosine-specific restriction endonuclease McrA